VHRRLVVEALSELADAEVRERRWTAGGGGVSSLEECICRLYDDSGLGDALDRSELVFSERIDCELSQLRRTLRSVRVGRPPEDVLRDLFVAEAGVGAAAILASLTD
jgi:hypothetical protein